MFIKRSLRKVIYEVKLSSSRICQAKNPALKDSLMQTSEIVVDS